MVGSLLLALVVWPVGPRPASAEGEPQTDPAVAAVREAARQNDEARLQELAGRDDPDPWLLLDAVMVAGHRAAAEAFARASPPSRRQALATFVDAWPSSRSSVAEEAVGEAISRVDEGDLEGALGLGRRAAELFRRDGEVSARWEIEVTLGLFQVGSGRFRRGIEVLEALRPVLVSEAPGEVESLCRLDEGIGIASLYLGRYREAIAAHERAVAAARAADDALSLALNLNYLGVVRGQTGALEKAHDLFEQALEVLPREDDPYSYALVQGNLGVLEMLRGRFEAAQVALVEARDRFRELQDPQQVGRAEENLGRLHHLMGRHEDAIADFDRAAPLYASAGDPVGAISLAVNRGDAERALAERPGPREDAEAVARHLKRARTDYLRALSLNEGTGLLREEVLAHIGLAALDRMAGDHAGALGHARAALDLLPHLVGGLSLLEGASARGVHATVFEEGIVAAVALRDPDALFHFLESGRAGAQLELLGGEEQLRTAVLPESLATAARRAREDLTAATTRLRVARAGGRLREIEAAGDERKAALGALAASREQVTRASKSAANLLYGTVTDLTTASQRLGTGEALVLYFFAGDKVHALVIEGDTRRIVTVGPRKPIDDALEAARSLGDEEGSTPEPLAALTGLLVDPLGLDPAVRRVLVSPAGELHAAPFPALLPEVAVALVPSASAWLLLLDRVIHVAHPAPDDGGVLAIGGVDYRGTEFYPLPRSEAEAHALGDVVLTGADATESRFLGAVAARTGWRAIHAACHGSVSLAQPLDSALHLTPGSTPEEGDGRLTAFEILGSHLPAELVTLSACDVAQGEVIQGEGLIGLTQAFLLAGSRRVVSSLWPADDEAATVLMTELHRLLRSGEVTSPAEALRQAQARVREARPQWQAPYFWAGWVLWGAL